MKKPLTDKTSIYLRNIGAGLVLVIILLLSNTCSDNSGSFSSPNAYSRLGDSLFSAADYDSAIVCFEKAANDFKMQQNMEDYIFSLAKIGNSYRKMGRYKNAISSLNYADSLSGIYLTKDHPAQIRINNETAASYYFLGNFKTARTYYIKSLNSVDSVEVYNNVRLSDEIVQTYNLLGMLDFEEGFYEESMADFEKGVDIRNNLESDAFPSKAMFYGNFAIVYSVKGDYENAAKYYEMSLKEKLVQFGENHPHVALDYQNMGVLFGEHIGDYNRAQSLYEKALRIVLNNYGEKHIDVARIHFNMGTNYYRSGNLEKALQHYDKALTIYYDVLGKEYHHDVSMSYNEMGRVYENLKKYKKATEYYELALSIRLEVYKTAMHPDVAHSYNSLGNIKRLEGKFNEAISYFNDALKILRHSYKSINPEIAETYNMLAQVYIDKKDYKTALSCIQMAVKSNLHRNIKDGKSVTKNAVSDIKMFSSLSLESEIYYEKFLAGENALTNLNKSLSTYKMLSELINNIRKGYKATGSKLLLAGKSSEIMDKAIKVCTELYKRTGDNSYMNAAFEFSEQNKSRILLDAMVESDAQKLSGIPDSLLSEERQLRIDLAFYDTELQYQLYEAPRTDSIQVSRINERLFALQNRYLNLKETFEKNYPEYHELKYKNNSVSIDEVKSGLGENETLVEYFAGKEQLYIFTISKQATGLKQVDIDTSFAELCRTYLSSIKKVDKPGFLSTSEKLYNILISPVENLLVNSGSLMIIPDGILHYIPFESLIKSPGNNKDFTSLDYLINNYEVAYNYSAAIHTQESIKNQSGTSSGFIGFAPIFDDSDKGFPASLIDWVFGEEDNNRNGRKYNPLPFTKDEVNSIKELFAEHSQKAEAYLYDRADEENFKHDITGYKYIHIASHSFINSSKPQLSAIVLSKNDDDENSNDGILYSGEIYNLNLNADLVVLSSCESGIGRLEKGEGMMALTRGFLFSGAGNVITSLWKVLDKNTSKLMEDFYKNVLDGKDFTRALRNAKLSMIKDADTAFPLNWSGFVLIEKR